MTILTSELKVYRATINNDTASNGGRMSSTQAVTGVVGNAFPNIQPNERTAGSTKYRKFFYKAENDDDLTFLSPRLFVLVPTPGDDVITIFSGTHSDTQAGITGSERQYGGGKLNAPVSALATAVTVLVENETIADIFEIGDEIVITDKQTGGIPDITGTGNIELRTLTNVSNVGPVYTLTFSPGLDNAYSHTNTQVCSSVIYSDIIGSFDSFIVTAAGSGDYDEIAYPVLIDSIGGVYDNWVLTFTSTTAFTCVGTNEGSVGSGNTSSDFSPVNSTFSKPYFKLMSAGWSGSFAINDTVSFTTYPASAPFWAKRVVPAGAGALSPDNWTVAIYGAST